MFGLTVWLAAIPLDGEVSSDRPSFKVGISIAHAAQERESGYGKWFGGEFGEAKATALTGAGIYDRDDLGRSKVEAKDVLFELPGCNVKGEVPEEEAFARHGWLVLSALP